MRYCSFILFTLALATSESARGDNSYQEIFACFAALSHPQALVNDTPQPLGTPVSVSPVRMSRRALMFRERNHHSGLGYFIATPKGLFFIDDAYVDKKCSTKDGHIYLGFNEALEGEKSYYHYFSYDPNGYKVRKIDPKTNKPITSVEKHYLVNEVGITSSQKNESGTPTGTPVENFCAAPMKEALTKQSKNYFINILAKRLESEFLNQLFNDKLSREIQNKLKEQKNNLQEVNMTEKDTLIMTNIARVVARCRQVKGNEKFKNALDTFEAYFANKYKPQLEHFEKSKQNSEIDI